jgi:hypothetical protein
VRHCRHDGVTIIILPFTSFADAGAKARPHREWPLSRRAPRATADLCCPCTPAPRLAYKRPPSQPPGDPNSSHLGGDPPLSTPLAHRRRRRRGGRAGEPGDQPQVHRRHCEDPEAARVTPGCRGAVNHDTPVPLLPLRHAADSSLAADPAPLPLTDACTSAHGHSSEERSLLPSVKPNH